ncbi:hypothetical protein CI109_102852 [Kwoniella shandongensis]|uniref:Uncharacterized protein n=1 Tax=Kwoniella shandongensis TaxID=1734106 RepID=A0AAJ8MWY0_9TREE
MGQSDHPDTNNEQTHLNNPPAYPNGSAPIVISSDQPSGQPPMSKLSDINPFENSTLPAIRTKPASDAARQALNLSCNWYRTDSNYNPVSGQLESTPRNAGDEFECTFFWGCCTLRVSQKLNMQLP